MVVHSEVFERFTQGDTIPVMARAVMENAISPRFIDGLFEDLAERQYPKAALFGFCVALLSYNVMSTVKAAIRGAHGIEAAEKVSGFYLADEIKMSQRGMMRAIPKDEWVGFQEMPPQELAELLIEWARSVPLAAYAKRPRGPKPPKPEEQSGAKIKHVATSKILKARDDCT